jgi:chromosomal replication initiator protein
MYLCRTLTDTSTTKVGNYFGGKDHTTVLHACEKIAKKREDDSHFNQKLSELIDRIRHI